MTKTFSVSYDEATNTLTVEIYDDMKIKVINQTKAFVTLEPPNTGEAITAPSVSVERRQKYKFKKGDRVIFLTEGDDTVKEGATGTVLEESILPFIKWDNASMLTKVGTEYEEWKSNNRLCASQNDLMLITPQP